MFADFVPAQIACLPKYTDLLPGTAEVVQRLQKKGIKIGVSTGFLRAYSQTTKRMTEKDLRL